VNLLLIGGTQFVGRAVASEAMSRGHHVTVFHRGVAPASGLDGAVVIKGDRDSDLSALESGEWDATVDVCAYRPHQVDLVADALGGRGGHHAFISTVSVYAGDIAPSGDETSRFVDLDALSGLDLATCEITDAAYGPLKVLAEQRVHARYTDPLIIRPTYVLGPRDYTMRFPTWIQRIADGGVVEVPLPSDVAFQYIDVADQAQFIVDLLERRTSGIFNTAAPSITFEQMINTVAAVVGGPDLELRWVDGADSDAESGRYPLWSGTRSETVLQIDASAAFALGLTCRPLAETARETLDWLNSQPS